MSSKIHVGTSGWNYGHWQGPFYPEDLPSDRSFSHYSKTFDTVEINNTFYQQPEDETFDSWREQAPEGFLYAVKANRYLTHMKKLKEPGESLEDFLGGVGRLKDHLGPILYQLPPRWKKNLQRLREFADVLPRDLTHVLEFRDRDWLADDTYELMAEYNLGLCVHDMLPRHPRRLTGPVVYVRFHGTGGKYTGKYPPSRLQGWADWIKEIDQERDVFVYFNNDDNAYAVKDAMTLQGLLAG